MERRGNIPLAQDAASAPQLNGEAIMGVVNKLSNWGWSQHPRFLKLNKRGLSYFKNKPPGELEQYKTVADVESKTDEYKPKYCVPLDAIVAVEELNDSDRGKYKKHFKGKSEGQVPAFKVVFTEKKVKVKVDILP